MILDTTNISSGTSVQDGTVVVEKWVWEWYQDALNIAKTQLAKLEIENKELREKAGSSAEYTEGLRDAYRNKCVEARALEQENKRIFDDLYRTQQENEKLRHEIVGDKDFAGLQVIVQALRDQVKRLTGEREDLRDSLYRMTQDRDTWRKEAVRLEQNVDTHWVYLEDVILGLADASARVREVAKEIKQSRGGE